MFYKNIRHLCMMNSKYQNNKKNSLYIYIDLKLIVT